MIPRQVVSGKVGVPERRGLARARLDLTMSQVWSVPLTTVVASAGWGRTTALAQFARTARAVGRLTAWYRADAGDAAVTDLLRHLEAAIGRACGVPASEWTSVEVAAACLGTWAGPDVAVVIDDFHTLDQSPASTALEHLIACLPPSFHVVLSSRLHLALNLSRMRVSGDLVELGSGELRFRMWEADELFREQYNEPLPPDVLAELVQQSGGWPAGLQLAHQAWTGRSAAERRRLAAEPLGGLRQVREYLVQNTLAGVDPELHAFLVHVSCLNRLTTENCNALLDDRVASRLLAEAERRGLLRPDGPHGSLTWCHGPLQHHLQRLLDESNGPTAAVADAAEDFTAACQPEPTESRPGGANHFASSIWPGLRQVVVSCGDVAGEPDDDYQLLVAGLGDLVAGRWPRAVRRFDAVMDSEHALAATAMCASLARAFSSALLHPERDRGPVLAAVDEVEWLAPPWLLRAATSLAVDGSADAAGACEVARQAASGMADPNPWLLASLALAQGVADLLSGQFARSVRVLAESELQYQRFGAAALASWSAAIGALATAAANREGGRARAESAARSAEAAGCVGAQALACRVAAATTGEPSPLAIARAIEAHGVIDLGSLVERVLGRAQPTGSQPAAGPSQPLRTTPAVAVQCFGRFALTVDGRPVDCHQVKPRAKAVLHILALRAGRSVHRDQLLVSLWPDCEEKVGLRNLQVAMSALRHLLEPGVGRKRSGLILREGEGYALTLGRGSFDLGEFERATEAGRAARAAGRFPAALAALESALELYKGELLPEAGAAEWVLEDRERFRLVAADVAQILAECRLELGDYAGAAAACERGLQVDRYRDGLWRTLIDAHERAADRLAAARANRGYEQVLAALDISTGVPAG